MRLSAPVPGYLRVALGIAVALVFIAPLWWVVAASFKPQFAIFRDASPVTMATFLPFDATLDNYREVFGRLGMGRALINSTIVAVSQVILTLVLCSTGAYAFSRLRFPGRQVLFVIILGTLLVRVEPFLDREMMAGIPADPTGCCVPRVLPRGTAPEADRNALVGLLDPLSRSTGGIAR